MVSARVTAKETLIAVANYASSQVTGTALRRFLYNPSRGLDLNNAKNILKTHPSVTIMHYIIKEYDNRR